jgi:hypothetical protein
MNVAGQSSTMQFRLGIGLRFQVERFVRACEKKAGCLAAHTFVTGEHERPDKNLLLDGTGIFVFR